MMRERPGSTHRPDRPHELGPSLFRRRRWWAADLRPWGGGRMTLRDPGADGWPDDGARTDDLETAGRWMWAYVGYYRGERKRRERFVKTRRGPRRKRSYEGEQPVARPEAGAKFRHLRLI